MRIFTQSSGKRSVVTWLAAFACSVAFALSAWGADLGSAKEQGLIGEQPNGYLGLVRNDASADIRALVDDVNAKRKAQYQRIADQQGTLVSEVEKVGGVTAIEKTRRGHYVMDASGRWRRK